VAFPHRQVSIYYDMEVDIVAETHFSYKALVQPNHSGHMSSDFPDFVSRVGSGATSASSRIAGRSCRHALYRMTSAALRAAQRSAAAQRSPPTRAIDTPAKAKADVMASLRWCQASLLTAMLPMESPTAGQSSRLNTPRAKACTK